MANIKTIFKDYDAFAWIPSVKGSLSYALIGDVKSLFGDVDKYIVSINSYDGLKSQHHIAATSLLTFNDSKTGPNYSRTFRYIFCSQINSEEENHNVLKGRLCILAEVTSFLSNNEVTLLKLFQHLTKLKKEYDNLEKIEAASIEMLAIFRKEMIHIWGKIKNQMDIIEKDKENPRINFCFDVALTRDGLLLLKYDRNSEYASYIFEHGGGMDDENDYLQHLPLHRVFKVSSNIIRSIFFTNNSLNANRDILFPVSNLHPYSGKNNLEHRYYTELFHRHLDSLLFPLTWMSKNNNVINYINPNGIFLFANSLINVFGNNKLIDKYVENKSLRSLKALREEFEIIKNNVQLQKNNAFSFAASWTKADSIALFSLVFSIISYFYSDSKDFVFDIFYLIIRVIALGYLTIWIANYILRPLVQEVYTINENKHLFFFKNSNLEKGMLSKRYVWWIKINEYNFTTIIFCRIIALLILLKIILYIIQYIVTLT